MEILCLMVSFVNSKTIIGPWHVWIELLDNSKMTSSIFCSGTNLNPSGCMVCVWDLSLTSVYQLSWLSWVCSSARWCCSLLLFQCQPCGRVYALHYSQILAFMKLFCHTAPSLHPSFFFCSFLLSDKALALKPMVLHFTEFFINFFLILSRQCCLYAIINLQHPYFNLKESCVFFYISSVLSSLLSDASIDFCFHWQNYPQY